MSAAYKKHVDEPDVDATYPTMSTASSRPFARYHTEDARRRLGIGAGAADEHLYCCLYEYEDTALEERAQASRFLTDAYDTLPWVTDSDDPRITSEQAAEDFLLSRVDDALAAVRRANSQDVTVSMNRIAEFSFGRYTAGEHCQWCQHNQLACAPDSFTVGPGFEE